MSNSRIPVLFFLFLLLLGVLQWVNVYPQLPSRVACHFAADGTPNGWQPKQDFFLIPGLAIALCIFVSFVLPRILALLPPSMINLPNKSYWLAEERLAETVKVMNVHLAWFGCGFLFVILYAMSQAIHSNLPTHGQFDANGMLFVIAGFLLYAFFVFAHMLRYFLRVPPSNLTA